MANGINVPVQPGKSGGAAILRGSKQKGKILRLALSPGDDKNPFQDIGIKERAIFQSEDALAASDIKFEVQRILKKFEGKIIINPEKPITIFRDPKRGFGVEFEWIDLETNDKGDFSEFFQQPGAS